MNLKEQDKYRNDTSPTLYIMYYILCVYDELTIHSFGRE